MSVLRWASICRTHKAETDLAAHGCPPASSLYHNCCTYLGDKHSCLLAPPHSLQQHSSLTDRASTDQECLDRRFVSADSVSCKAICHKSTAESAVILPLCLSTRVCSFSQGTLHCLVSIWRSDASIWRASNAEIERCAAEKSHLQNDCCRHCTSAGLSGSPASSPSLQAQSGPAQGSIGSHLAVAPPAALQVSGSSMLLCKSLPCRVGSGMLLDGDGCLHNRA